MSETVLPGSAETPGTEHGPGEIVQVEVLIISLLTVASLVYLAAERLRIPYTIGLVIIGFGLTLFVNRPIPDISPEIILALLLPPLLFEAAYATRLSDLRRNLPQVLTLAIPGVILTMLLAGALVWLGTGMPLSYALVFGALIAPTDPVAVIALFKSLGVPKRLQILIEGESLTNDGTAIVFFKLMLTFALTGQFEIGRGVLQFFLIAGGGLAVGTVTGALVSLLIRKVNNHLLEMTFTTILAYGSFLIAEYLIGVSGVLAVVAAGLSIHQLGKRNMAPGTQIAVFNFWEYAAFLANSFVFLLIGLQTDLNLLLDNAWAIVWGILAVVVARAIVVYGLLKGNIPEGWRRILFWGGLRGAVSLALVLSLTIDFNQRAELQAMTFGVVLFTLLVQGLTITPLIRRSQVIQSDQAQHEQERRRARIAALEAANTRLEDLQLEGSVSQSTMGALRPFIKDRLDLLTEDEGVEQEREHKRRKEAVENAWREALNAQRSKLIELYKENTISEEVYNELSEEVDKEMIMPDGSASDPIKTEERE